MLELIPFLDFRECDSTRNEEKPGMERLRAAQERPYLIKTYFFLLYNFAVIFSSAVKLAYESLDATSEGEDLPPIVILHGLFGSKTNWRTLAKLFNRETDRKVHNQHPSVLSLFPKLSLCSK